MPVATAKRAFTYDETKFDMPKIAQSKTVLWFPDRHLPDCYTAFVTQVGDRAIDLAVILPEYTTLRIMNGVRHRNDPDGEIIDANRTGVWDFPEGDDSEVLLGVVKRLTGLAERVERLEKK